jgi:hypothetical protein
MNALILGGEIVTLNGCILMLREKLVEVPVKTHGATIITRTIVLTKMVLSLVIHQPGVKMELTILPTVGEIAQLNTAQFVLEAMMQQACGSKIVLKLEVITKFPQKQLSRKTFPMLKKLLLSADAKQMNYILLVSYLIL